MEKSDSVDYGIFSEIRRRDGTSQGSWKRMNAILNAVESSIRSTIPSLENGEIPPAAYFCSFLELLEESNRPRLVPQERTSLFLLFSILSEHLSPPVLHSRLSETESAIKFALRFDPASIVRGIVHLLSKRIPWSDEFIRVVVVECLLREENASLRRKARNGLWLAFRNSKGLFEKAVRVMYEHFANALREPLKLRNTHPHGAIDSRYANKRPSKVEENRVEGEDGQAAMVEETETSSETRYSEGRKRNHRKRKALASLSSSLREKSLDVFHILEFMVTGGASLMLELLPELSIVTMFFAQFWKVFQTQNVLMCCMTFEVSQSLIPRADARQKQIQWAVHGKEYSFVRDIVRKMWEWEPSQRGDPELIVAFLSLACSMSFDFEEEDEVLQSRMISRFAKYVFECLKLSTHANIVTKSLKRLFSDRLKLIVNGSLDNSKWFIFLYELLNYLDDSFDHVFPSSSAFCVVNMILGHLLGHKDATRKRLSSLQWDDDDDDDDGEEEEEEEEMENGMQDGMGNEVDMRSDTEDMMDTMEKGTKVENDISKWVQKCIEPATSIVQRIDEIYRVREEDLFESIEPIMSGYFLLVGCRSFFMYFPFTDSSNGSTGEVFDRSYLLPVLSSTCRKEESSDRMLEDRSLQVFRTVLLPIEGYLLENIKAAAGAKQHVFEKNLIQMHIHLWEMFPFFCLSCQGFSSEVMESTVQVVRDARNQIESFADILRGMNILVRADDNDVLRAFQDVWTSFVPVLFSIHDDLMGTQQYATLKEPMIELIRGISHILSPSSLNSLLANVILRLVKTQDIIEKSKLYDIALCFMDAPVSQDLVHKLLMVTQKDLTALMTSRAHGEMESVISKTCYQILMRILPWIPEETVVSLLHQHEKAGIPQRAKKHRLALISRLSNPSEFLFEIITSLKDPSQKVRSLGFSIIVAIASASLVPSAKTGTSSELSTTIYPFIVQLCVGLESDSPLLVSATIQAVSRVIFEYALHLSCEEYMSVADVMLQLFQTEQRDVARSLLRFVMVSVQVYAKDSESRLVPLLERICVGLSRWIELGTSGSTLLHIKRILSRLMSLFSFELLESWFPESQHALLKNIDKAERRSRAHPELKKDKRSGTPRQHIAPYQAHPLQVNVPFFLRIIGVMVSRISTCSAEEY
eukprot:TRINITY_DN77_c0_g1_i1.p1 TRINITY_DN77_c0_g1~~TRINITY_DN77_c0_g1_i1.p1  ORF type:complete len:1169 (-),score=325.13 TRINITY_DN77_c0_g1_i1:2224-5676(-)